MYLVKCFDTGMFSFAEVEIPPNYRFCMTFKMIKLSPLNINHMEVGGFVAIVCGEVLANYPAGPPIYEGLNFTQTLEPREFPSEQFPAH